MHPPTLTPALLVVAASLLTTAAADGMSVYSRCPPGVGPNCPERRGLWYTDNGIYQIDARGFGCLRDNVGVPGIHELCIDWNAGRGHFHAVGQPKRCIKQRGARVLGPNGYGHCLDGDCYLDSFHEVTCTW